MAEIHFITAPIGGGKSLFGTINICNALLNTNRLVVTTIPLILRIANDPFRTQRLFEMLANKESTRKSQEYWTIAEFCDAFSSRPIDVEQRLVVLTNPQAREFYRAVPLLGATSELCEKYKVVIIENKEDPERPCRFLQLPMAKDFLTGEAPDFSYRSETRHGIDYHIDEAHMIFPARSWQSIGPGVERYQSQLRKMDDNLYLYTQHPDKVDKNMRRNATGWKHVQNLGTKRLFMGVSLPGRFRLMFYDQPEMPTKFERPTTMTTYKFDAAKRYHFLYRTMQGVSIAGGLVSESRPPRRSPLIWILAMIACIGVGYALPRLVQTSIQHIVGGMLDGAQKGFQKGSSGLVNAAAGPSLPPPHPPVPVPAEQVHAVPVPPPLPVQPPVRTIHRLPPGVSMYDPLAVEKPNFWCTGYSRVGTNIWVFLSDHRICKSERGEVQGYGENFVRVLDLPEPLPIKPAN